MADLWKAIIGGPAYRMECDVRHAQAIASLGIAMYSSRRFAEIAFNHQHGCPVEIPRNKLFKAALASDFTHLIWLDSDCYFDGAYCDNWIWICEELVRLGLPFCAVPVAQRNGACNIVPERTESAWPRLQGPVKAKASLIACDAAGMAAVAFWLPWYRKNWPDGPHFRTDWEGGDMISEDFWHTWQLTLKSRERHGLRHCRPRYAPIMPITHGARGKDPNK